MSKIILNSDGTASYEALYARCKELKADRDEIRKVIDYMASSSSAMFSVITEMLESGRIGYDEWRDLQWALSSMRGGLFCEYIHRKRT